MKKLSTVALSLVTALALSAAPIASATARDWDHGNHRGHEGFGDRGGYRHHDGGFGFGAAFIGATAALITAPFLFAGELAAPPPAPVYYAPPPTAYGYPGYYYAQPRRVVVYGYPPGYAYRAYAPY